MRSAWVVVVAACATKPPYARDLDCVTLCPRSARHFVKPDSLDPRPWTVGQWAEYESRFGTQIVIDAYRVVAIDSCGKWLEHTTETSEHRWQWLFCFREGDPITRPVLRGIIATVDHQRPRSGGPAPEIAAALSVLVPPNWLERSAIAREDVQVGAGHFAGAVRARSKWVGHDAQLTVWAHPGVPFGGVLRIVADDGSYEQELIAFGQDHDRDSPVAELVTEHANAEAKPLRPYFDLDFGFMWLTRPGTADFSFGGRATLGAPLTHNLDAMIVGTEMTGASSAADPSLDASAVSAAAGARWTCWRRATRGGELSGYLQGALGYSELDKYMGTQDAGAAHGLAIDAAAGLVMTMGGDWNAKLELGDTLGIYDAHEGVRHLVVLNWGIQLVYP